MRWEADAFKALNEGIFTHRSTVQDHIIDICIVDYPQDGSVDAYRCGMKRTGMTPL